MSTSTIRVAPEAPALIPHDLELLNEIERAFGTDPANYDGTDFAAECHPSEDGKSVSIGLSIPDPRISLRGTDAQRRAAAAKAFRLIRDRFEQAARTIESGAESEAAAA